MLITLPLYVLRELGKALGLSILIYGFILLAVASGQMMRDGASIFTVLTMLPYMFPLTSPMVLPLTIITGTLICYGRLAGGNEYTAAQASGINPLWLAGPALLVAGLAACITVFLNADVLDIATSRIERSIMSDTAGILQRKLSKPGSIYLQNRVLCRMRSVNNKDGIDITEFADNPDKVKPGQTPRWDPEYPHQVKRIIAHDHSITRVEDEGGELHVGIKLVNFNAFDLSSRRIQPFFGAVGNPTWPAGKNTEVNISGKRLKFTGFLKLIRMRTQLHENLGTMLDAIVMPSQITDWRMFCAKLDQQNRGAGYEALWQLWSSLPAEEQKMVTKGANSELNPGEKAGILSHLNRNIINPNMFQSQHFNIEALTDEAQKLIRDKVKGKLTIVTITRLNRLLLEAVFPGCLKRSSSKPQVTAVITRGRTAMKSPAIPKNVKISLKAKIKSHSKQTAEIHFKLALSFSCFFFALVAFPLGLLAKRNNSAYGFAIGIVIAVVYYLLTTFFQAQVRTGMFNWYTIWIPNLVLFILGIVTWIQARRAD